VNFLALIVVLVAILIAYRLYRSSGQKVVSRFYQIGFLIGGKAVTKGATMDLKANDALALSIQPEDKFGNPVVQAFDAPPVWTVADPTIGTVNADPTGLTASFLPSGKEGATQLQVSGAIGGVAQAGQLPINVIAGDVAQIVITPGAVTPQ
jgi:hypothetical protein